MLFLLYVGFALKSEKLLLFVILLRYIFGTRYIVCFSSTALWVEAWSTFFAGLNPLSSVLIKNFINFCNNAEERKLSLTRAFRKDLDFLYLM